MAFANFKSRRAQATPSHPQRLKAPIARISLSLQSVEIMNSLKAPKCSTINEPALIRAKGKKVCQLVHLHSLCRALSALPHRGHAQGLCL